MTEAFATVIYTNYFDVANFGISPTELARASFAWLARILLFAT